MRTNRVTPKGIIRITGEHDAGDGACDEVINLRYEQGTMRLCGKKGVFATSATVFKAFYVHRMPGGAVYIGVYDDGTAQKVSEVDINTSKVAVPGELIAQFSASDTLDVKFINNLCVISSEEQAKIYTYAYIDSAYRPLSDGTLPDIQLGFAKTDYYGRMPLVSLGNVSMDADITDFVLDGVAAKYASNGTVSIESCKADVNAGLSYIRHASDKHRTEGWVAVCATLSLFDNSETKPTQPVWFYLGGTPNIRYGKDGGTTGQGSLFIGMPTSSLTVNIAAITGDYAKYKDLIRSVNIYSTYPMSGVDMEKTFSDNAAAIVSSVQTWALKWKGNSNTKQTVYILNDRVMSGTASGGYDVYTMAGGWSRVAPKDFDNALFRLQKSIPYQSDYASMCNETVELDFSEAAVAEALMPAENSGYVRRFGKMEAYNSRIHLYDLKNTLSLPGDRGNPDGLFGPSWMYRADDASASAFAGMLSTWTGKSVSSSVAVCTVLTKKEGVTLRASRTIRVPLFSDGGVTYIVVRALPTVADVDSYEATVYPTTGKATFALRRSASYNYAYGEAIGKPGARYLADFLAGDYALPTSIPEFHTGAVGDEHFTAAYEYVCVPVESTTESWDDIGDDITEYDEIDTVVASAQNNPTYFSPENSYRIGGRVLGIAPNADGISEVTIGQYPLAVFTDNGIYSLVQGDGKILYSRVAKIAEDVAKEGSALMPTTYGVAFLAGDGVFILKGRQCARISLALDGPPDWDIRQCEQYIRAHKCTETHLYAWKHGSDFVYTDSITPSEGNIAYNKYGEALPLRISGAGGTGIEYDGDEYTYSESDNVNLLYDISDYLSDDFRDEIADTSKVRLLFDSYKAELIVSITDRPYSYVYSFAERQWHKITETFAFGSDNLALLYPGEGTEIRNINDETFALNEPVIAHLQTRCTKFGTESYKSVHRLLGRVNINNTHSDEIHNGDLTGMYLYASRDMRHWAMVGLYQHKGYTDLMHVNKTAAHFKYFIITLGGKLIKDSEITGFDADVLYRYQDKER